ncbi:MAG: sigma 54-interacting transcriptional regulator [Desulfohalobiaceae bacterium]|nr:sigma 54-interacting transcriptional regulator [Desulfohalobiaceae bacterium]
MKNQQQQIERLEETVQELNEVIDLSADGLVSVDSQGILLRMNKAYEDIVGVRARDFIGKPALELKKQGYLPDLVSLHVLRDMQPKHLFVQLEDKEVLLTGRPVFNSSGELIRIVANIRDLTDLNKLKEELRRYQDLTSRYETELKQFRVQESASGLVCCSKVMKHVVETAVRAAQADVTTLISGETGTGKEIVARIIHRSGQRKDGPFITVNCAALPESLLEAELFGYEQGAFTGAKRHGQMGLFEAAQGGVLFLDEIGELPASMQAKLLRAIQEKKIRRISGSREVELDLNLVAASNDNLKDKVAEGLFRADLYYRLNVIHIPLPPLRQRMEDIPFLVKHFLNLFNKQYGARKEISQETIDSLLHYDWPGNVRELENTIERLVVLDQDPAPDRELVPESTAPVPGVSADLSLQELMEKTEKEAVQNAYHQCRSTRKAALKLKISQATMSRKLQKYGPS